MSLSARLRRRARRLGSRLPSPLKNVARRLVPVPTDDGRYASVKLSAADVENQHFKSHLGGGADAWEARGRYQVLLMKSLGLAPATRFLDIGCGPLRAGVHFIEFLDPGCYRGFDYNADFIEVATAMIEEEDQLRAKSPRVELVSDFEITPSGQGAEVALAFSVLNHCSPLQREAFFANVVSGLVGGATVVVTHARWFNPDAPPPPGFGVERIISAPSELGPGLDPAAHGWDAGEEILPIVCFVAD